LRRVLQRRQTLSLRETPGRNRRAKSGHIHASTYHKSEAIWRF
jgi:hypothetical protein